MRQNYRNSQMWVWCCLRVEAVAPNPDKQPRSGMLLFKLRLRDFSKSRDLAMRLRIIYLGKQLDNFILKENGYDRIRKDGKRSYI